MSNEVIKRKIAALLRLTKKAGCSESEALAAAQKAAVLMAEHGLSEAEIVMDRKDAKARSKGKGARDRLWGTVARCTNTACIYSAANELSFIGLEPGPAVAVYLHTVLNRAFDQEIAAFKLSTNYKRRRAEDSRRAAVHDFTVGMALRMAVRLRELFEATVSDQSRELALKACDEFFPNSCVIKPLNRTRRLQPSARSDGWAAGGRVNLSHGVSGVGSVGMIGSTQ